MTQIAPFLKLPPPSQPAGSSGNAPEPARLPLARFLRRFAALLMDIVLLYVSGRLLASVAGDALLRLGRLQDAVGLLVPALYFGLGNGPVGKGQTLGKLLVGIRTTTRDGAVPGFGRALARTALVFPGFIVAVVLQPFVEPDDPLSKPRAIVEFLPLILLLPMFAANVFAIVFNPFRQGLHDFIAGTNVRAAAAPPMAFAEICAMVGGNWMRLLRQAQVTGWATFLLVSALIGTFIWNGLRGLPDDMRAREDAIRAVLDESGLQGTMDSFGHDYEKAAREITPADFEDIYDPASHKEVSINLIFRRIGPWDRDDAELAAKIERFAEAYHRRMIGELPADSIFRPGPDGKSATNLRTRPVKVTVTIASYVRLAFVTVREIRVREFETVLPPLDAPPPETATEVAPEDAEASAETPKAGDSVPQQDPQ